MTKQRQPDIHAFRLDANEIEKVKNDVLKMRSKIFQASGKNNTFFYSLIVALV